MNVRVRFAPSPTGSLHLGSALSAVANRRRGDWMLLRIDDTDAARNVAGGEEQLVADLEWLGIVWNDGPVRQSDRRERHLEAAQALGERFDGITLVREDGRPTYHLASVVDDIHFGITHVIRGNDHRPNEALHRRLHEALRTEPPEYVHHGLVLGPDGKKLSKRSHGVATVADLREQGIPPEAVRAYLEELDLPRHDVHLDLPRVRRLAIDAIALPDRPVVPDDPEPLEVRHELLLPARHVPGRIGVVDPQQHPVAAPPVGDGREGAADVQRAGRARGEADADVHGWGPSPPARRLITCRTM